MFPLLKQVQIGLRANTPEQNHERLSLARRLVATIQSAEGLLGEDRLRLARTDYLRGQLFYYTGKYDAAIEFHERVLPVARELGVSLWLHGHIHTPFHLPPSADIPFPVICAGSATQTGRWSHNEYELDGRQLRVRRKVYDPDARGFREAERYDLALPE